jgi:hypothetical protein
MSDTGSGCSCFSEKTDGKVNYDTISKCCTYCKKEIYSGLVLVAIMDVALDA